MENKWKTKNIENCIEMIAYTNKIQQKDFLKSGIFPVISQEKDLINGYWNKEEDVFHISKPIVIFGDHTKILKYVGFDFVLGADGVKLLQPKEFLYPKYFYYYLQSINLRSLGYARHYRLLKEKDINYPESISEQKRIVKILDEAFEKLDIAKKNTEKNLQNSRELFESYLKSVFLAPKIDWEEKRFDEICVLQRGFDLPKKLRKEGKFALVSSNGITDRVNLFKVRAPGVVTGRSGTIGNVHFVEEDFWPLNTSLYIRDFHGNNEKFIFYFLRQFNLNKFSSGAGVPTLNRNNVHSEIVWFPKLIKEQKILVKKLDQLSEKTQKLETLYKQKLECIEELKKSILNKAFSGEI